MKKGKWIILLLTMPLLMAVVFSLALESESRQLEFMLISQEKTEQLKAWEKEPGEFYVFLPSYGQLSQLQVWREDSGALWLGDTLVENGMSCQSFRLNQRYTLQDGNSQGSLTFVQSANIPTLFIDTDSRSMGYVHKKKGNKESGSIRLYSPEGAIDYSGRLESIKTRGNFTADQEKKPYSLKLSQEADLLGMGTAQKWILLANFFDPTHMRNKLVYDFASELGLDYSPECRWVDVYLNGEYAGLYLLSERNEVHPQRVALTEAEYFLVSREMQYRLETQHIPHIVTPGGVALRIHDSSLGIGILEEAWSAAENAMEGKNGIDPVTGQHWSDLIDLDSWAKKYLIEEVFGNVDGAILSQYFYMDGSYPGSKIFAGPVWDYDIAMGNPVYWEAVTPEMLYVNRAENCGGSGWYYALCQDAAFRDYITQIYSQQFLPLLDVFLNERVPSYQILIRQAAWTNQLRWNTDPMEPAVEYIQDYMHRRAEFLNHIWLDGADNYVTLSIVIDPISGLYSTYVVQPGDPIPQALLDLGHEWYTVGDDKPFDITQPITSDVRIYYKAEGISPEA